MTTDPELLLGASTRVFIQTEGPNPANGYDYMGCLMLDSPNQDLGTPDPLYCPSSEQRNAWVIVDDIPKAPALGTTDFTAHADKLLNDIWFDLKKRGCKFNMQVVAGDCQRPDQFDQWGVKLAFQGTRLNNLGLSGLNPLSPDDNSVVDFTGTLSFRDWYVISTIKFAERADATVVAEVLDGLYFDIAQCGDCGAPSDGCNVIYLLTASNAGSPGLSSQLVYSLNGGQTWATLDIPTLGGLSGNRLAVMGSKVVVVSQATGSHHYSAVSSVNAGSVNWTNVSTGYVSTKGPRAIYVKSSNQAFIAGAGGYIYYLTSPTAAPVVLTDGSVSTQALNDIHGHGTVVVAVGGNNAVLYSANDGDTFSLVTGPLVGANLTSVWVYNRYIWFIGSGTGKLYYTLNAGSTWTEISLGAGVTTINDIHFENDIVGYIAAEVAGVATIFRTTDTGHSWSNASPDISGLPTAVRANFVWSCGVNNVLTGGRKTVGGDGVVAIAE